MSTEKVLYTPGQRVRVIQQVARQRDAFTTSIEGTVVKFEQQKTGSWYAHAQDNKLWLDRLELRKDDGETVILNLDRN
jgi:succinylglutamate desuccinylase